MIRHVAAVAIVIVLSPAWLHAQVTELTVNTASANVHKGPSIGSPVIGKAPRGAVLEVTRELGDWVKVDWPSAPDSAGYIRLTAGSIRRAMPGENGRPARTMTRPLSASGYAPLDARAEYAG